MFKLPPLSLYIHIPWCIKKCPYCDFNSYAAHDTIPEEAYILALIQDIKNDLPLVQQRSLISIFFGGGTPSLFSPTGIGKILEAIASLIPFSANIEITLEANPGTLEHKDFSEYQKAGVNRISLGVQSFQDEKLKSLGRIHNNEDTKRAINSILKANLNSFNIDIMYGLPNQTQKDALSDLKIALEFSPPHLSWYNLTIEPNTIYAQKPPMLPTDDAIFDMYEEGLALLATHHLKQYEVSAYSTENYHCRHNVNYWEFGDYLGIGAGAHAKISHPKENTVTRFWKTRYPKSYLAAHLTPPSHFLAGQQQISTIDLPLEFMLNALRLSNGIPIHYFEDRTGISMAAINPLLAIAVSKELLTIDNQKIIPTALGRRFLNDLVAIFIPNTDI